VYPEEVEETLKLHPAVLDANVVGLPDDKWGQSVTGVVSLVAGTHDSDELRAGIVAHVKEHLAGYKCPKRLVVVERIQRGPNGKADYRWATATAQGRAG
jgi:3-oxocholest-4-en-26-oate---CoA ligase